ncbi:BTAD domain-containing putative transcriptional regulator [Nonomuraea sp. NPDC050022]|uniref:BTAD domain-containing putative transcriptional regulator n=1 Tax=Nonomuraea sp. NPDC050022 TaxID=3364358 RepID=UPI0037A51598
MRIGILGPLQIAGAAVGGARVRALLVRLALDPGRVVTNDRLIDDLWPGEPPEHPMAALQSLVSRARREAPGLISSHPSGYLLDVPADEVDAQAFERLARTGDAHAALALWRGPALGGIDLPFALAPAARLEELRLAALVGRIAADLAAGGDVVAELEELVAEHRLREPFHALLMRAMVADGRRGQALEVFERIRARLADELGVDPGAELREAHLAALRDEEPEPRSNLPARLTSFVGRSDDVARIRTLFVGRGDDLARIRTLSVGRGDDAARIRPLTGARLITLVGPGGAGKTRLAVEAAATLRVPDGVWLVELAPAAGVRVALEAVFKTSDLVRTLRGTSPVIVLDNCEHLIDEAARVAQWLLGEVAGLRIIATSREPLNIPGETLHPVLPLAEEPAVELLRDRAAAARPDLSPDPAEAARICRELDGIPLAIELAAARLRTMPVSMLVEQLGDRLGFRGSRTSEPRHRTLRAVIDWSWDLLSREERELLRGLSVFSGGATAEAIGRVCGGDLDLLSALVDKSLIALSGDRYTMLETIRQYVTGDLPEIRQAHARYYAELAEAAEPHLRTGEQVKWLAVLDAEQGNLDAAFRHSDDPLRIILPRLWPWIMRGRRHEVIANAATALRRVGDVPPEGRELAHGLCMMATMGAEPSRAVRESDHPAALHSWAMGIAMGPPRDVVALTEASAQRLREHPDAWTRSTALLVAGIVRFEYGAVHGAEALLEPALDGLRGTGDRWGQWTAYFWLSLAAENRGDFARALALAKEPEPIATELAGLGAPLGPMMFLLRLSQLMMRTGDHAGAATTLERAWQAALRSEDELTIARVTHARAELARRSGDPGAAARLLRGALAMDIDAPPQFRAFMNIELARVSEPAEPSRRALELMATCEDRTARATVLEGVAEHRDPLMAAELLGAARVLRGITESADPFVVALAGRCRAALGAERYADALVRGAAIPNPERYALSSP